VSCKGHQRLKRPLYLLKLSSPRG